MFNYKLELERGNTNITFVKLEEKALERIGQINQEMTRFNKQF